MCLSIFLFYNNFELKLLLSHFINVIFHLLGYSFILIWFLLSFYGLFSPVHLRKYEICSLWVTHIYLLTIPVSGVPDLIIPLFLHFNYIFLAVFKWAVLEFLLVFLSFISNILPTISCLGLVFKVGDLIMLPIYHGKGLVVYITTLYDSHRNSHVISICVSIIFF